MATKSTSVQFAKGFKSNYFSGENNTYNEEQFNGFLYFSDDTNEIYVDGEAYGIGGKIVEQLKANNFVSSVNLITDTSTGEQHVDITYYDSQGVKQFNSITLFKISGKDSIKVRHKTYDVSVGDVTETYESSEYEISLLLSGDDYLKHDYDGLTIDLETLTGEVLQLGGLKISDELTSDTTIRNAIFNLSQDISTNTDDISNLDASISALMKTFDDLDYRVNDVDASIKTDISGKEYKNISIKDSNIPVNKYIVNSGVLSDSSVTYVSDALNRVSDTITWFTFE